MKLQSLKIFEYKLPLTRPLVLRGQEVTTRNGLLVQLCDGAGHEAWGEVAPLPGFSRESLDDAMSQLKKVAGTMIGRELPPKLELLDGGFGNWLGHIKLVPSVWVGIETAALQLLAADRGISLLDLACSGARDSIAVNALLDGTKDQIVQRANLLKNEGFSTFKVKVGRRALDEEIEIVKRVRETVGSGAKIRLDANRSFDIETAWRLAEAVAPMEIEYIEEPVANYLELMHLTRSGDFPLPLALDESVQVIAPKALTQLRGLKAIVLKPTLIGFEWAMWFARRAHRLGMLAVMSSSFESTLTLAMLAHLGGCLNGGADGSDVAMGLDTVDRLAEDLTEATLPIRNGRVVLSDLGPEHFNVTHGSVREVMND